MSGVSDVGYWLLVLLGIFIVGGIMLWLVMRTKSAGRATSNERTEQATRELYQKEDKAHKRDPGSGL